MSFKFPRKKISTFGMSLLVSIFFIATFNQNVFTIINTDFVGHNLFLISTAIFLVLFTNLLVSLFAFKYLFKPWLVILFMIAAFSSFFMKTYGVIIDETMVQNTFETDVKEAMGLFSWNLVVHVFIFGVLPSIFVILKDVSYGSFVRELINKVIIGASSIAIIVAMAFMFYVDYASLLRTNRQLRDLIVPTGPVYRIFYYVRDIIPRNTELKLLGVDAQLGEAWKVSESKQIKNKKVVTILVVGETARAENFSLATYARETNPELKKQEVIYFNNFSACGTTTTVSLPCMFSLQDRKHYNAQESKYTENLLDILQRAGLDILWRDNNTGCKFICSRIDFEDLTLIKDHPLCVTGECFDMILLNNLQEKIDALISKKTSQGLVIVMHQMGSHGPAYYKRVPEEFKRFTPICLTNQMKECTKEQIVNAYDNTILYTDHVIAQMIKFLKFNDKNIDGSLVYVSDHGESLGENNVYLHGMPYAFAPVQQTHIPALFWSSKSFEKRFTLDKNCLKKLSSNSYSHDNLFHSMLGLLNVTTKEYEIGKDIFSPCKKT